MKLAIFDLDHTLINGDSDFLWGQFLISKGVVDKASYERTNSAYYADYAAGTLDIDAFLKFSLQPLTEHSLETLTQWHAEFMHSVIEPVILPAGRELVAKHREAGDQLLMITATNDFITRPIATALGFDELLAIRTEIKNQRYTGNYIGVPSFREGKITRLHEWLADKPQPTETWFYSDSKNDIPLLAEVDHPYAVDPDDTLRAHAEQQGWEIISLR